MCAGMTFSDNTIEQFNKPRMIKACISVNTQALLKPFFIHRIRIINNYLYYMWYDNRGNWSLGCLTEQQMRALKQFNAL